MLSRASQLLSLFQLFWLIMHAHLRLGSWACQAHVPVSEVSLATVQVFLLILLHVFNHVNQYYHVAVIL